MPPKVKITKEDIIKTALQIVRENGAGAVNARAIASVLECSTQPIFSNFSSMEELESETLLAAYEIYLNFLKKEESNGKYPQYKAFGMAYIRFAQDERELFKMLFMCDRKGEKMIPTADFDTSVGLIMNANNISKEKAELMHLEMWTCVHGIAAMIATSFLCLEWETISKILSDVYFGIREKHVWEKE
ncbi:MAG: TetR/AcrR family transcriptional regulator [Clostridia bacterium]|nr:TetR/AcrR family transcriptional regulator [Clostridia bacterium]